MGGEGQGSIDRRAVGAPVTVACARVRAGRAITPAPDRVISLLWGADAKSPGHEIRISSGKMSAVATLGTTTACRIPGACPTLNQAHNLWLGAG